MKERLKVLDYKYNIITIFFLFVLAVSLLAPLSGNDWMSFVNGKEGLIENIKNLTYTNGGLLSDTLAGLFTNSKGIFALFFAIFFTITLYNIYPLLGKVENKNNYLLIPLLLLLVGVETFSYNYISVTGCVCYTFPALAIINYFLYLYRIGNEKLTIFNYIKLFIAILFVSLTTVHLSIAFLLGNFIFYAYKMLDNKKKFEYYIILVFIHIFITIGTLFVIDKSMLYPSFDLFFDNIPSFIDATFSKNILLVIIGLIPIEFYLNEKLDGHSYKRVIIVLFALIPFISLAYNFFNYSPVNLNLVINRYSGIFATENWYFIFYFMIYMLLFMLTIIHFIKRVKTRNYLLLFIVIGLFASIFKFISPDFNNGTNILFVFSFIISTAVLYKEMDIKVDNKMCFVLVILMSIYYLVIFGMCKYIDDTRLSYIKEQKEAGLTTIEVKSNPFFLVYRYNPTEVFQKRDFKQFIEVSQDTKLEVKYFGVFKEIESRVKE